MKKAISGFKRFMERHGRYIILAMAAAFLLFGIFRLDGRELRTVMKKAVKICMECIGLG